jgi:hypothetical protein
VPFEVPSLPDKVEDIKLGNVRLLNNMFSIAGRERKRAKSTTPLKDMKVTRESKINMNKQNYVYNLPDSWKENISRTAYLQKIKMGRGISTTQCAYQEAI